MIKKLSLLLCLITSILSYSQDTGSIVGKITDKDYNNEPLAFANVIIKGTTTGTTSDFDGIFGLENLAPGSYTLVFSFVGYETTEVSATVVAGKVTEVNVPMGASAAALDEIVIKAPATRGESEAALLFEQKKAVEIKESIGAARLSKIGVNNASAATTKIAGVTKSEGSGDIYIRGLGDRYLSTTMNGLPIPSDDVNNKNINLNLFSTNIISNVGISKTYTTFGYADQTSGNVDISSKEYSKKGFTVSVGSGYNTNVIGLDGSFKRSIATEDVTFGFHEKQYAVVDLITRQGWEPVEQKNTGNYSFSLTGGTKFDVFGKELAVFVAGSHRKSYNFQEGLFRSYRSNVLDNEFLDVDNYTSTMNTTGYGNVRLKLNDNHRIKLTTLAVNKSDDAVYEQGRRLQGYVFDQDPKELQAFVRDQNFKQTSMWVNQLNGEHSFGDNNRLTWGAGYNFVLAEEPNRVRNEANIYTPETDPGNQTIIDTGEAFVQYAHVGDFQQRKSSQKIEDTEYNAFVKHEIKFGEKDEDENQPYRLNIGANFRQKERIFKSQFIGVRARDFQVPNVDSFSLTFTPENLNGGLVLREPFPDLYTGELNILAGFASLDFGLNKKFSGNVGVRYERDEITVGWDVGNWVGRIGSNQKEYTDIYPSINLKYELNEKQFLRFASSLTQTLPEFKELAPFEYVSPTGRVTRGNPGLEKSEVFNADLKWEFFPKDGELVSATAFYKQIKDPINLALTRGSAGIFEFANTGEEATVFGLEVETRINLIENEEEEPILNFNANITQMWFNQDLLENYQYKNLTESDLQGASDFIFNGSISYNSQKEKEFIATLTGNYSSDKVFALGAPEDFANSATLYNDEIIEKGFVTLDLVLSKKITDKLQLRLVGRNLLNPDIDQTQLVRDLNTGVETNETVLSYKNGTQFSLNLKYSF